MKLQEKIEFIDKTLVDTFQWKINLKNLLIEKVKRAMPDVLGIGMYDDGYGNCYICIGLKDDTIHSLYEIKDEVIIEELYDLCLFIKED